MKFKDVTSFSPPIAGAEIRLEDCTFLCVDCTGFGPIAIADNLNPPHFKVVRHPLPPGGLEQAKQLLGFIGVIPKQATSLISPTSLRFMLVYEEGTPFPPDSELNLTDYTLETTA